MSASSRKGGKGASSRSSGGRDIIKSLMDQLEKCDEVEDFVALSKSLGTEISSGKNIVSVGENRVVKRVIKLIRSYSTPESFRIVYSLLNVLICTQKKGLLPKATIKEEKIIPTLVQVMLVFEDNIIIVSYANSLLGYVFAFDPDSVELSDLLKAFVSSTNLLLAKSKEISGSMLATDCFFILFSTQLVLNASKMNLSSPGFFANINTLLDNSMKVMDLTEDPGAVSAACQVMKTILLKLNIKVDDDNGKQIFGHIGRALRYTISDTLARNATEKRKTNTPAKQLLAHLLNVDQWGSSFLKKVCKYLTSSALSVLEKDAEKGCPIARECMDKLRTVSSSSLEEPKRTIPSHVSASSGTRQDPIDQLEKAVSKHDEITISRALDRLYIMAKRETFDKRTLVILMAAFEICSDAGIRKKAVNLLKDMIHSKEDAEILLDANLHEKILPIIDKPDENYLLSSHCFGLLGNLCQRVPAKFKKSSFLTSSIAFLGFTVTSSDFSEAVYCEYCLRTCYTVSRAVFEDPNDLIREAVPSFCDALVAASATFPTSCVTQALVCDILYIILRVCTDDIDPRVFYKDMYEIVLRAIELKPKNPFVPKKSASLLLLLMLKNDCTKDTPIFSSEGVITPEALKKIRTCSRTYDGFKECISIIEKYIDAPESDSYLLEQLDMVDQEVLVISSDLEACREEIKKVESRLNALKKKEQQLEEDLAANINQQKLLKNKLNSLDENKSSAEVEEVDDDEVIDDDENENHDGDDDDDDDLKGHGDDDADDDI